MLLPATLPLTPQCLVGADGSALLHRVARLNDPDITEQVGRRRLRLLAQLDCLHCISGGVLQAAGLVVIAVPQLPRATRCCLGQLRLLPPAGMQRPQVETGMPQREIKLLRIPQEVRDICASIDDKDAGANCAVALHQAASQRQAGAGPRLRFQVRHSGTERILTGSGCLDAERIVDAGLLGVALGVALGVTPPLPYSRPAWSSCRGVPQCSPPPFLPTEGSSGRGVDPCMLAGA